MDPHKLEVEAISAADAAAQPGDILVVAALPGTGKTTLLQQLAKACTEPAVFVMFNRKPCDEFKSWLVMNNITNVHATTFHKLAFDAVAESGTALERLDMPPKELVVRAEARGLTSVTDLVHHMPEVAEEWYQKAKACEWSVTSEIVLYWMAHARIFPELLETPSLRRLLAARRVYVDEAQDCSLSMVKIILMCKPTASIVLAGDTNQDINGFMGSVDPVGNRDEYFPDAATLPLSHTWRFHAQIAAAFNQVSGERCVGRQDRPDAGKGPVVVLCGTNAEVDKALAWFEDKKIKAFKRGEGGEGVEVSTVHKAKGGGWHTVVVMRLRRKSTKVAATAVSRARERLYVHYSLMKEYNIKATSHVRRFGDLKDVAF